MTATKPHSDMPKESRCASEALRFHTDLGFAVRLPQAYAAKATANTDRRGRLLAWFTQSGEAWLGLHRGG